MKVALVHDYLKEYGGAERVLEALHQIYPQAPVYTSFVDWKGLGPHAKRLKKWDIKKSWMHYLWPIKKLHSPFRFLAPLVWKYFDFKGFDVVISSSGWFMCKGIKVPTNCVHICYLHHPPRHLYGYTTAVEWQKYWLVKVYATIVNHFLRMYDFDTSQKVDHFIVNSKETKRRCFKFYRRESTVIYPPASQASPLAEQGEAARARALRAGPSVKIASRGDRPFRKNDITRRYSLDASRYYLCVSRLARAKHIDLAIEACQKLNLPLKIVGKGRDEDYLKSIIKRSKDQKIKFLGEVKDEELAKIYAGARALIFPSEDEEFGIVSIEAQAHGVPVIGLKSGGIPETLVEGKTGVLFDCLTVDNLVSAIERFEKLKINPKDCINNAKRFSAERFKNQITQFVNKTVK